MESSATFFYWQVHKIVCQQTNHGITQYSQHLVSAQQLCKSLYTGDQKKQSCPLLHGKIKSATVIQITTAQTDMKVCHYPPHPLLPKREKNKWQICYLTVPPPPQKKIPPPKKEPPTKPNHLVLLTVEVLMDISIRVLHKCEQQQKQQTKPHFIHAIINGKRNLIM